MAGGKPRPFMDAVLALLPAIWSRGFHHQTQRPETAFKFVVITHGPFGTATDGGSNLKAQVLHINSNPDTVSSNSALLT